MHPAPSVRAPRPRRSGEAISSDPDVPGGAVVFTGTRVPLKNFIDYLEAGDSIEVFLDHFPSVRRLVSLAGPH